MPLYIHIHILFMFIVTHRNCILYQNPTISTKYITIYTRDNMINCLSSWPEPIVRVQHLSDSGILLILDRYVKKPLDRPSSVACEVNIPVIDMHDLYSSDQVKRSMMEAAMDCACREWGFFQVVNHGVSEVVMTRTRQVWRDFFGLALEEKQKYANLPSTYEGYGSRLGVDKDVSLDWSDYFFLHLLPIEIRDYSKWPSLPVPCRELVEEYSQQVAKLGGELTKVFSKNLGLGENYLDEAFGGANNIASCLRVNYYPKCPQPDLTLGLSPHSDPGGMTLLLPDENVSGLQVRHGDDWVTVKPVHNNAIIVNIGDQLQVLSNAHYKSVEHRVTVNSSKERVSLAFFYNPMGDILMKPAEQLMGKEEEPLYPAMTFNEYRLHIRTRGLCGKSQVHLNPPDNKTNNI